MKVILLDANLWLLPYPLSKGKKERITKFVRYAKKLLRT